MRNYTLVGLGHFLERLGPLVKLQQPPPHAPPHALQHISLKLPLSPFVKTLTIAQASAPLLGSIDFFKK